MAGVAEGYDVIGDVHGHADELELLLRQMEYERVDGVWQHPVRQAVFVGDLIDRGPQQVETVDIVRPMVEAGAAQIILGNHEFNGVSWATEDPSSPGEYLRSHNEKHRGQHGEYLRQVGEGSTRHHEHLGWFMTLPLWLDLGGVRVVHACWDTRAMADIAAMLGTDNTLTDELVLAASRKGTKEHRAIEHLLKGPEISIPVPYLDKDGNPRHEARLRWWLDDPASNLRRAAIIPGNTRTVDGRPYPELSTHPVEGPMPVGRYVDPVPVIYGHYWEAGVPTTTSSRTVCVDYSVARDGPLVAYRWQGESALVDDHFVSTPGPEGVGR